MRPPVLTKKDFVRRYQNGEFGNASPTWDDPWQVTYRKDALYHIRNRIAGGKTYYNIRPRRLIPEWITVIARDGYSPEGLYISEMAPSHLTTLQGEVMRDERYLHLRFNRIAAPMREGFQRENLCTYGVSALCLLRSHMDGNSWGWLNTLFDEYPDHVIEFSVYSKPWGTLAPAYNTIFWEVRKY